MILKLLKKYTDPAGKSYDAGKSISVEDTAEGTELAKTLLFDGTAQKGMSVSETEDSTAVEKAVKLAIDKAVAAPEFEKQVSKIVTKDLGDSDPFHGFLPGFNGVEKDVTPEMQTRALGNFAKAVYDAGEGFVHANETLKKSIERSANVVSDGMRTGVIGKTAGDGLSTSINSEAGVLCPPAVSMALLQRKLASCPIRQYAKIVPMTTKSIEFPRVKNYTHSSGLVYGGCLAYWKSEEAELTASKPVQESIRLSLNKLTALGYVSDEAQRWSAVDCGGMLLNTLGGALGWKETQAFISGTGVGQPLGLIKAPCAIAMTEQATQTTTVDCVVTANVDEMFQRLYVEDPASCVFIYNRLELYSFLRAMYRLVGTTGGTSVGSQMFTGNPLSSDAKLDGVTILDSEHCPARAVQGAMLLTDLSQYCIASDSTGPTAATSLHLKFEYAQNAYRIIEYVDAQPMNSTYFTRANGAATASSIVMLPTMS